MSTVAVITFFVYSILNIIVFGMYGLDKYKAKKNEWRIPEKHLLFAAALAPAAAFAGMMIFRHKTRKAKFEFGVPAILMAELAICYAIINLF